MVAAYQMHPNSGYHKLRYYVRCNHEGLLKRINAQYGAVPLTEIRAAQLNAWRDDWSAGGKTAIAQSMLGQISTMSSFGICWLEEPECERISLVLSKLRSPPADPRGVFLEAHQAEAVRMVAHSWGWHSMALAQAIQFDLMLRQKDVIGEYVPFIEPGESDVRFRGQKWLRGIRWDEVDGDMVLKEGDKVYNELDGGIIHADCCGPERESYYGADEQPLKDDEPIPEPWIWTPMPAKGAEG